MSWYTQTITGESTVFTPPADCATRWTYEASTYNTIKNGLLMQNMFGDEVTTCYPESFDQSGRAPSTLQMYSPGACPAGYTAPASINNAGTTTATCCPSNFNFFATFSSSSSEIKSFQGCISVFRGSTSVPARANQTDLNSTLVTGPMTMWAQPIFIAYNQQDLALFTTTGTTISSKLSSQTPTQTSSQSNPQSSSDSNSGGGISTAAKAGIGISIAIVIVTIIAAIFFFMRYRSNKKLTRPGAVSMEPFSRKSMTNQESWSKAELDPQSVHYAEVSGTSHKPGRIHHAAYELQ